MSVSGCAAAQSNRCQLPGLAFSATQKHFCLRCGLQKHGPCGVEYSEMCKDEMANKDVLDVIAPKKNGQKDEERTDPTPAGEIGVRLEICHHCIHEIRSSTLVAAQFPSTAPSNNLDLAVARKPATCLAAWAAKKDPTTTTTLNKMKKKEPPLKRNSKPTRAGKLTYTVEQKLRMIEIYTNIKDGTGRKAEIAAEWGVNDRTVRRWIKQKAAFEASLNMGRSEKKTVYSDRLPGILHGLNLFLDANSLLPRHLKLPVTSGVVSAQALKIKAKLLQLDEEKKLVTPLTPDEVKSLNAFTASRSWASKKLTELGYKSDGLHGGAADVDAEVVAGQLNELREKMRTYLSDNIYNMDETGLMFKCLPSAQGTKMMKVKDRVTLCVCTNATGTDFCPLSVIGNAANPHCFRNHLPLKLKYYEQKKAWSDTDTFKKWWNDFVVHIRLRTNDRVLLILDNCGPHCGKADEFMKDPQVEVVMLPPNCKAMYRPMDSGVIAMIKRKYRYRLLSKYVQMFEVREQLRHDAAVLGMTRGTKGLAQGYAPHVRDCIDLLHEVQGEVEQESLFNCWKKSTLLDQPTSANNTTTATALAPTTAPATASALVKAAWNLIDNKVAGDNDNQQLVHETYAVEFREKISELADLMLRLELGNHSADIESDENDLELILDEFAVTLKDQVHLDDVSDVDQMLDEWVAMEDTELMREQSNEEVMAMLDSTIVDDSDVVLEDGKKEDDEEEDVEMEEVELNDVTPEIIDEICAQLVQISARLNKLKCDENEFGVAASRVAEANSSLRLALKKFERNRVAKK